jgi:hypothetical protein
VLLAFKDIIKLMDNLNAHIVQQDVQLVHLPQNVLHALMDTILMEQVHA